ncbi:MAG: radical SAM-linked protein, partial [Mesotoga sp.]
FMDLSVTSLRTVHVVKYSQPIESMVTAEEILKILSKEGTASYEGVIAFVEDGMVNGRSTSDILDEIGGI